jgi:hypothetical protein
MAELGTVVGIASFAVQIGDSALKLKSFWDSIKQAPEEITYLIDEIETLGLVLSEIKVSDDRNCFSQNAPACAKKCLELCRKSSEILMELVRELEVNIKRSKSFGAFKAVLKKDALDKLKERLKSAQFMLLISYQTYSE